jgi:hypothetical protein
MPRGQMDLMMKAMRDLVDVPGVSVIYSQPGGRDATGTDSHVQHIPPLCSQRIPGASLIYSQLMGVKLCGGCIAYMPVYQCSCQESD